MRKTINFSIGPIITSSTKLFIKTPKWRHIININPGNWNLFGTQCETNTHAKNFYFYRDQPLKNLDTDQRFAWFKCQRFDTKLNLDEVLCTVSDGDGEEKSDKIFELFQSDWHEMCLMDLNHPRNSSVSIGHADCNFHYNTGQPNDLIKISSLMIPKY